MYGQRLYLSASLKNPQKDRKTLGVLTPSHILPIIPAFEKCKLICSLTAQKMPTVVRVPGNQKLLPDIMGEDQISRLVVSCHINGLPVTIS